MPSSGALIHSPMRPTHQRAATAYRTLQARVHRRGVAANVTREESMTSVRVPPAYELPRDAYRDNRP